MLVAPADRPLLAVDFKNIGSYTQTMGFPEASRRTNASGQVQFVCVQISASTFIEPVPGNAVA